MMGQAAVGQDGVGLVGLGWGGVGWWVVACVAQRHQVNVQKSYLPHCHSVCIVACIPKVLCRWAQQRGRR